MTIREFLLKKIEQNFENYDVNFAEEMISEVISDHSFKESENIENIRLPWLQTMSFDILRCFE